MSRRFLGLNWYGYWQNLHREGEDDELRDLWREGRAWLHISRREGGPDVTLKAAWHIGSHWTCDFVVSAGDALSEDDAGLHVSIPGVSIWLSVRRLLPKSIRYMPGRWIGWTSHHGAVYAYLWADPTETRSRAPFTDARSPKRQPVLHVEDLIKGKTRYIDRTIGTVRLGIALPEATYPATVRIFESMWRRDRWPGVERVVRAHIIPDVPIPIPGKGTESYNCGDDASYEITTPATAPLAAVSHYANDIVLTRRERAGADWMPTSGWPDPTTPR